MAQSRIKVKNRHLKKQEFKYKKPAIKIASLALVSYAISSPVHQMLNLRTDKVEADALIGQQSYIQSLANSAKPVANANGLYPSVMIAQALLESDWGKSTLSRAPYNNLFGIQGSYNGNCVYMKTQEYINGRYVEKVMPFRKYPSLAESFADNAHVLKTTNFGNGYYYAETWRANASTYQQATSALTGKYATDPNYGNSLNNIIQRYNLTQYDGTGNVSPVSSNSQNNVQPSSAQIYTVMSGDSLWSISQRYNVSINQIKALNNLRSDMIYVGQKLKVSQGSSTPEPAPTAKPTPANHPNTTPTVVTNKTIQVVSGNTLSGLAYQYKTTVAQLKAWNNLRSDMIYVGQTLIVSKTASSTPSRPTPTPAANHPSSSIQTHKVVSGDSLWNLSHIYGVSIQQLRTWNHLNSYIIYIGQTLRVR
ncbi:LysM peptidoglycan-binding domain-containing protein [Lactococcus lactis]|uniref:LysM peptidoglycan-binding domain-containing protein n=1 Tax=Lactococcus lactis TaxID=1358 RepID=UPI003D13FF2A